MTDSTRRAVVRTAANAAWAVPVIGLATAAPALAASGPAVLSATAVPTPGGTDTLNPRITLTNANTQASTALAITIEVLPAEGVDFSQSTTTAVAGFTYTTVSDAQHVSVTFIYTATSAAGEVPGNGTLAFNPTITLLPGTGPTHANVGGALSVQAQPDGLGNTRGEGDVNNMTFG